jgi:CO dehydrogenase maturation factor
VVLRGRELLVLDTDAGVEHLGRKVAEGFDMMLIIAEPSIKAVETANRIYGLSRDIGIKRIYGIGNKTMDRDDEKFIAENLAFPPIGFVPYDKTVLAADREGLPLMNYPDSPAHMALDGISRKIEDKIKEAKES